MTNTELLRDRIEASGYKLTFLAEKMNRTYQALLNKINNKTDFTSSEIKVLTDCLSLTNDEMAAIFFAKM